LGCELRRPAGEFGFASSQLHIALPRCLLEKRLSLLEWQGMLETMTVDSAHSLRGWHRANLLQEAEHVGLPGFFDDLSVGESVDV
jgi:hypothetical protein